MAIPHNSKCRYGERGAVAARPKTGCCKGERRQWRKQRTEAGAAVAECEGLLPPKHDAGTATRHYRVFWQRRCRAAAAGAVLKPSGGNCAVLPLWCGCSSLLHWVTKCDVLFKLHLQQALHTTAGGWPHFREEERTMRFTFTFHVGRKTITLGLVVKSKNRHPDR